MGADAPDRLVQSCASRAPLTGSESTQLLGQASLAAPRGDVSVDSASINVAPYARRYREIVVYRVSIEISLWFEQICAAQRLALSVSELAWTRFGSGKNLKPRKVPENAQSPTCRVHALLGAV